MSSDLAVDARATREALRRQGGARRRRPPGAAWRHLRAARPERRRQDHHGPHPHHAAAARRRAGVHRRHRRGRRSARCAHAHRAHRPVRGGRGAPHRSREHGVRRPPVPHAQGRGPGAVGRAARAVRSGRRRRSCGQGLLGRHAPPARHRDEPDRPAVGAVPRRADHRARPAQPARDVGSDRRARAATAPRCCSPPSTSTRPTGWPTGSS